MAWINGVNSTPKIFEGQPPLDDFGHPRLVGHHTVSTRKTSGEFDLGAALQCGIRIETAREPTTQSLLLSVSSDGPMSCLHFIRCSFGGVGD